LVGDLHQPLHVSTLFNSTFPEGDAGGNMINIIDQNGKKTTLHKYWDDLLENYEYIKRPLDEAARNRVHQIADDIMNNFPFKDFEEKMQVLF